MSNSEVVNPDNMWLGNTGNSVLAGEVIVGDSEGDNGRITAIHEISAWEMPSAPAETLLDEFLIYLFHSGIHSDYL